MRIRTALILTAIFVAAMFVLQHEMLASMQTAIATGRYLPQWWRFLFGVAAYWSRFWPGVTVLVLGILLFVASRTGEPIQ